MEPLKGAEEARKSRCGRGRQASDTTPGATTTRGRSSARRSVPRREGGNPQQSAPAGALCPTALEDSAEAEREEIAVAHHEAEANGLAGEPGDVGTGFPADHAFDLIT